MRSQRVPLKITNFFKISVMSEFFGENADLGDFLEEISQIVTICSRREKLTDAESKI